MEKRKTARVCCSLPVRIRGYSKAGHAIQADTLVDNISAGGLYFQLGRPVAERSRLFAIVRLASGGAIAARGFATRIEQRPHGLFGVAMQFTRARLLRSSDDQSPSSPVDSMD